MRSRAEPWKSFAEWLVRERGLGPASVSTYQTQVRRILAAVDPLTLEGIVAWIDALPIHHRSPHRTAYRTFAAWAATEGKEMPGLPLAEPSAELPPAVLDALLHIQERSGLGARGVAALRWGAKIESPAKAAAFPEHYFFAAPPEVRADYALLHRASLDTVTAWAYPNGVPGPDAPLVPRAPEDRWPMPATALSRLLRERRRVVGVE